MGENSQKTNFSNTNNLTEDYQLVVIGLGYVGLTLAGVYAQAGFKTLGVDINQDIINNLKKGQPHFHENGLPDLLEATKDQLSFSTKISKADDKKNTIFVIAVGTSLDTAGNADYSQIDQSSSDIAEVITKDDVVILRSTVVVGTTKKRVISKIEEISKLKEGEDFYVGFAPERTVEGKAIQELRTLPQVIASASKQGVNLIRDFFEKVSEEVIVVDSIESAEMVKLISNAYRDLTFSFANSVALAAYEHNVDVADLIQAANHGYERNRIPLPSPGVGGYCLTKDPYLFAFSSPSVPDLLNLMSVGRKINDSMPAHIINIASEFAQANELSSPRITIVGLAFKSNPITSDIRFSPSLDVVRLLKEKGYTNVSGYDQYVSDEVFSDNQISRVTDLSAVGTESDIVIFMHGGDRYRSENFVKSMKETSREVLLLDTWSVYRKDFTSDDKITYMNLSYNSHKK
jgi:nucleotide sugar dehydrogenase